MNAELRNEEISGNANRPSANAMIASEISFAQSSERKDESGTLVKKCKRVTEYAFSRIVGTCIVINRFCLH